MPPVFEHRTLSDDDMASVRRALELTLKHHEPYPAIVLDRQWNTLLRNQSRDYTGRLRGNFMAIRDLFRGTTELLARRITEQASHSGEHYITESRGEFFTMYRAAAGAGHGPRTVAAGAGSGRAA